MEKTEKTPVIAIVGPTATGKTKLGVEIAKHFNGEIISADSMQIYKKLNIGTAKPTTDEQQNIPHHLIDILEPSRDFSVADYVEKAHETIDSINKKSKLPILVGGTGLYINSVLDNVMFSKSSKDTKLRMELVELNNKKGTDYLLEILKKIDIQSYDRLKTEKNPKRVIRAIEIYKTTGTTVTKHNEQSKLEGTNYTTIKIGLNYENRELLYDKINSRVDKMIDSGLIEECKEIKKLNLSKTAAKAIGYKELMPYIYGEDTLENCTNNLKQGTRRYAKRQLTWFRRDKDINWIYIDKFDNYNDLLNYCFSILKSKGFKQYG